ncbi:MAG: toxin HicA [Oscillospiraceae bacterium]|nr:toxin HicA [Oscillospiraceae bacterium]
MSKWDKLIEEVLKLNRNLRFGDLAKALIKIGYVQNQPKGGSSHYTFRKVNCVPVTLPKSKNTQIDIVYIRKVRDAIIDYMESGGEES